MRRVYKLARMATGSARLADRLTPRITALRLQGEYDLFLPVFNNPFEIFALDAIAGWREHCRHAACFISRCGPGMSPNTWWSDFPALTGSTWA